MKITIIAVLLLTISGCSSMGKILDLAGDANDNVLISAEATICRAASVGSVVRRYSTSEKARAWKELCTGDNEAVGIILDGE